MNYTQSLKLLTSQKKFHINLGLERIKKVAQELSNPQDAIKTIHIAGTNGKGSTCAMLAKIIENNGYKVGLYTSPHIKDYTERIKINFEDISKDNFAEYIQSVEKVSKNINIELTEFEMLTLVAFLYFKDMKVDYAIIETGIGGRLDATNIITKPILSVITSISKDHTDRLGNTIEEIAKEKAGIIKPNTPVIINKKNLGFQIISQTASQLATKVECTDNIFNLIKSDENIFSNGEKNIKLSLFGINQGENLSLVLKAAQILNLPEKNSLENIIWHGRFEYIKNKNLIIDAAHNPDGVKTLKHNLDIYFPNKKRLFFFGILNTKDYKNVIKNLFKNDDEIFLTDNFAPNAVNKKVLKKEIQTQFPNIKLHLKEINDIQNFKEQHFEGIKICCGSFYLISCI